jgi:hypothetical protein
MTKRLKLYRNIKKKDIEAPEYMKEVWEEEHNKFIYKYAEIKTMINLYK